MFHFLELTSNMEASQLEDFIIAPRELCQSCHAASGPKFLLSVGRDSAAAVHTTAPLSNVERALAEDNIAWAQSEGELLDEEIARVQQSLLKLQQRRNAVRQFEQRERGLLISHIHRLPAEVLRHIFLLTHGGNPHFAHDLNAFPRVAARVCSRWRLVAHSCAPLWTSVMCLPSRVISVLGTTEKYNPKYGKPLEDCVRFSDRLPFSFCLGSPTTPVLLGESCIQALGKCANRWNEVLIEEGDLIKAIFDNIPEDTSFDQLQLLDLQRLKHPLYIGSAPRLQRLFVTGLSNPSDDTDVHITVSSAPHLDRLRLRNISRPSTILGDVNSSRITIFESYNVHYQPDEFVDVMKRMPHLTAFTLHGPIETTKSVTHQQLESLTIGGIENGNVLEVLTAPRIKYLFVGWGFDSSAVAEFVRRCGCQLEGLKLTSTSIHESWTTVESENLKTLYWEDPFSIGASIQTLTLASNPSPDDIFPSLEHLHMVDLYGPTQIHTDEWELGSLINMLESRLQPQQSGSSKRSLKSVDILFRTFFQEDEAAVLEEFIHSEVVRSSGVEITVTDEGNMHLTTSNINADS